MKRILQALVVAAVFLAFASSNAFAWGSKGPRLTALVAYQLLTPSAKKQLDAILGSTGDIAAAALYLDIRKDYLEDKIAGSRDWHFDDRPVCKGETPLTEYCPGGNCAPIQIRRHYDILTDPDSTKAQRLFAIRVLTHLTGDIHQPLHASDHDDRGGNKIKLIPASKWSAGEKANLHSAWDNDFAAGAFAIGQYKGLSEKALVKLLVEEITDDPKKKEWPKGRVKSWLEESYELALDVAYKDLRPTEMCQSNDPPAGEVSEVELSDAYIERAQTKVPAQIKKGAVRLAAILNRALATEPPSSGYIRAQSL